MALMSNKDLRQPLLTQELQDESAKIVTHQHVQCDGCNIFPITGVRYKCCVCKDFDYCEVCEERLGHEHPFIKIVRAGDAPQSIITGLKDDQEGQTKESGNDWGRGRCGRGRPSWCHKGDQEGQSWNHRGGKFRGMFKHFMDVANNYATQFNEEEKKKEEGKTENTEEGKSPFRGFCGKTEEGQPGFRGFCEGRQKWGEKRAIIMRKPDQVIVGEAGQVVFAEIEVQNQTKWPWKRGCYIGLNRPV